MSIFETIPETKDELVKKKKNQISILSMNLLTMIREQHAQIFKLVWDLDPTVTTQELMDAFGTEAVKLFILSGAVQNILVQSEVGYEPLVPPVPYTINQDGSVNA